MIYNIVRIILTLEVDGSTKVTEGTEESLGVVVK
jgi:hypothetical protein